MARIDNEDQAKMARKWIKKFTEQLEMIELERERLEMIELERASLGGAINDLLVQLEDYETRRRNAFRKTEGEQPSG